ncbi:MAG TPA: bifunctional phosphoglucose/phosphomannose isomerase [Methylomirabilota bacterium]|nr:bifunctional phosphoglucose/phosphomannose isomerase [Methylomirabilota bacterium]
MMLDDLAALARIDRHDTRTVLASFPTQCRTAVALALSPVEPLPRPRAVIVAGMGGSAAGGDVLAACAAERIEVPVLVHRGYGLPALAGAADLVIVVSYSGDTVETLSAARTALERGCRLVAVTAGGRLAALARRHGLPAVMLPAGLMPRMALGYLFFPMLAVLRAADLTVPTDAEVEEALGELQTLTGELAPDSPTAANEAKRLALAIGDRVPVVYGGPATGAVAYRWKTDLEENAKTFAVAGAVPEMNHNEIEAWGTRPATAMHVVLLRDSLEAPEIRRRFAVLRELIAGQVAVSEAWTRGKGGLARLFSLIALGQWTSFYLAALRGVDPWAVPLLEGFKARLNDSPPVT